MSIKKKLAMGVATGVLAVSMIGGGTYAYFNDVQTNNSAFQTGTLKLGVVGGDQSNAIINIDNIKPGDTMDRTIVLENKGSLDIGKVLTTATYTEGVGGFGSQISMQQVDNNGATFGPKFTLNSLYGVTNDWINNIPLNSPTKELKLRFTFEESGSSQNQYQGTWLKLKVVFDAQQTAGVAR